MAAIGEDLLKLQIKEGKFSPVYIFYGEEDYMKKHYLLKIKQRAVGENFPEFNLHEIDGTKADINEIIELAMSVPMMSDYLLICVNDFDFSGISDTKIDALFDALSDGTILLFYYLSTKPNQQRAAWKRVMKLSKEKGSVVKFDKKDARELAKIAVSAAKKRGCYFPQYLASRFVERVGDDLNLIKNEIDKLCALKEGGEITAEDIEKISVRTLDASAFDLTKKLIAGDTNAVFDILEDLWEQQNDPVMILGAVNSSYIDMYRVKVFAQNGLEAGTVANFYSYNADWKLKRAAFSAKNLSLAQLRRSINVLAQADTLLKSVNSDARVILDQTIIKLLLIAAKG